MTDDANHFGTMVADLRRQRRLSLRQLGHRTHYSTSYMWEIEKGLKRPNRKLAVLLDNALAANGRLSALIPDETVTRSQPLNVLSVAMPKVNRRALLDQPPNEQPSGDLVILNDSTWAQMASMLYNIFVRYRRRLVRLGAQRYSRSMWAEQGCPFTAEVIRQGRNPLTRCHSVTRQPAPLDVATALGIDAGEPVARRENWYYADGEPIQIGVTYIPANIAGRSPLARQSDLGGDGLYGHFENLGYRLANIREQVTTRLPTRHECVTLGIEPTTPMLDLRHTGYDTKGRPFEVTHFAMRADLTTINYDILMDA